MFEVSREIRHGTTRRGDIMKIKPLIVNLRVGLLKLLQPFLPLLLRERCVCQQSCEKIVDCFTTVILRFLFVRRFRDLFAEELRCAASGCVGGI